MPIGCAGTGGRAGACASDVAASTARARNVRGSMRLSIQRRAPRVSELRCEKLRRVASHSGPPPPPSQSAAGLAAISRHSAEPMTAAVTPESAVEKVLAGERISDEDALALYALPLHELGQLAHFRRQLAKADAYPADSGGGRGNRIVTYIVDRNINYTNVCNVYCKFCAFYRTERDADHYVLSLEQLDQKLDELTAIGGVQILLQGGHHPSLGIDYYLTMLSHIRAKYPHI